MAKTQIVPIALTVVIFVILSLLILLEILVLNKFTAVDIATHLKFTDILVGLTIYLKTSVDFAILIGNLMHAYPGWKSRIAIETGTAVGNAAGTMIVLSIWNFFRDIEVLLALMIFIAALVLLKLAEEGFEHVKEEQKQVPNWVYKVGIRIEKGLYAINKQTNKFLRFVIPHVTMRPKSNLGFFGLLSMSFTIPFILGLDDFAGYVPVFNIVNVFGFAVGVLLGHMILNLFLFISPRRTIYFVKNPYISFTGSIVFIGLAVWGFYEAFKILFLH